MLQVEMRHGVIRKLGVSGSPSDIAAEMSCLLNRIYREMGSENPDAAKVFKDAMEYGFREGLLFSLDKHGPLDTLMQLLEELKNTLDLEEEEEEGEDDDGSD